MPNFDKTGPSGKGPKTGQGLGSCNGNKVTDTESKVTRRGMGMGARRGLGRGIGRGGNR